MLWSITVKSGSISFGGVRLSLKRGNTSETLVLKLYSGPDTSSSVLKTITVAAADVSNGSFGDTASLFYFPSAQTLTAGKYLIVLSSAAGTTNGYTTKGESFALSLDGTSSTSSPAASVAEATIGNFSWDLTTSKSGTASVSASGTITYTLGLGNAGGTDFPSSSTTLTVKDQLPTGVTATSASGASCTPLNSAGALLTCSVSLSATALPAGASNGTVSFTITTTAPSSLGAITNYASVDSTGGSSPPTPSSGCTTANCSSANTSVVTTPTLSVTNSPQTYTGSAIAATVSCSSSGTVSNILYAGSSTVPTTVGTYAVTADCAANGNYAAVTAGSAGNFVISAATPTLSVTNSPQTYTGSAIAATVSCSSSGTVSNVKYGGSSTVPTTVGTYAVTADCAANGNYAAVTAGSAGNFVISAATPTPYGPKIGST